MRVLVIVNWGPFLLSHRRAAIQELGKRHEVIVCHPAAEIYQNLEEGDPDEAIRKLGVATMRHRSDPWSSSWVSEARGLLSIWGAIRRIKPDLVHGITMKPILYTSLASLAGLKKTRMLFSVAGLGFLANRGRVSEWAGRIIFRNRWVICQNRSDQLFVEHFGPRATFLIGGSGVDLDVFRPAPVRRKAGRVRFLCAGRLLRKKGVLLFLEAARSLVAENPEFEFIVAGTLSPKQNEIRPEEIRKWCGHPRIRFVGHCRRIEGLLQTCDILVMPSTYGEGFPKAIIDASASGCAVITFDIPGCRDAVIDGVTGWVLPAGDAEALGKCMARLGNDRELIRKMGENGRKHAEEFFSIDSVVNEHVRVYETIKRESGNGSRGSGIGRTPG